MAAPVRLHYEVHGPEDADCILMVHGILSSRNHWKPNLPALTQSYRVVTLDLPAHGLSPAPLDPTFYEVDTIVGMVDDIRTELGISRWHIVGQSFGAGIALHYALAHPKAIKTVSITNANRALLPSLTPAGHADLSERIERLETLGAAQLRKEPVHPRFARYFPDEMRRLLSEDADQIDPFGFARLLGSAVPTLTTRDRLGEIKSPMLLVNGMRERRFQPIRDWIKNTHPQIRVVDLDGGHSINIENASGSDHALLSFLAASSSPPEAVRKILLSYERHAIDRTWTVPPYSFDRETIFNFIKLTYPGHSGGLSEIDHVPGFLTLSLIPELLRSSGAVPATLPKIVNYGIDRLRFTGSIGIDQKLTASFRLVDLTWRTRNFATLKFDVTVSAMDETKPKMIGDAIIGIEVPEQK